MKLTVICLYCGLKQVVSDSDKDITKCKQCGQEKMQMMNTFKKEAELNKSGFYK